MLLERLEIYVYSRIEIKFRHITGASTHITPKFSYFVIYM